MASAAQIRSRNNFRRAAAACSGKPGYRACVTRHLRAR